VKDRVYLLNHSDFLNNQDLLFKHLINEKIYVENYTKDDEIKFGLIYDNYMQKWYGSQTNKYLKYRSAKSVDIFEKIKENILKFGLDVNGVCILCSSKYKSIKIDKIDNPDYIIINNFHLSLNIQDKYSIGFDDKCDLTIKPEFTIDIYDFLDVNHHCPECANFKEYFSSENKNNYLILKNISENITKLVINNKCNLCLDESSTNFTENPTYMEIKYDTDFYLFLTYIFTIY
jgi:glutaredoxin-related protein